MKLLRTLGISLCVAVMIIMVNICKTNINTMEVKVVGMNCYVGKFGEVYPSDLKAITIKMDRKDIANSSFIMWQDRDKIINRGLKLSIVKHKDDLLKYSDLVFF